MLKKVLAFLMVGVMVFSLASCGKKAEEKTDEEIVTTEEEAETEEVKELTPLTPAPGSETIGDYTLTASYIPFDEPIMMDGFVKPDMDILGNTVYIGDGEDTVYVYTLDGDKLTPVKTLAIENDDGVSVDGNGNLYAGGGVFEAVVYDADGNETGKAAVSGKYNASKTSDFALTYFPSKDTLNQVVGGQGSAWAGISGLMEENPPKGPFTGILGDIEIVGDHVLVGGSDEENAIMAVFDYAGNQIAVSTDSLYGSLTNSLTETENGYIATAVGTINLVAKDGTYIGYGNDTESLFGVSGTCWIHKSVTLPDGSVLMFMTVSQPDADGCQLLLYKVTGF